MHYQRTLSRTAEVTGIGLHSGKEVRLILNPAPADTGIVFRRIDLAPVVSIPARVSHVGHTTLCTGLVAQGEQVWTVEHLLAALAGMGVDNAILDVDGPEVPILDGSALPFVQLLKDAGICEQQAQKKFVRINQPVEVADGDRRASLHPFDGFKVSFTIDFDLPVFREQTMHISLDFAETSFATELSGARTFGFLHEVDDLRARGFILGGSLENALVLDSHRILNPEGLRFEDEFVKHKVLDAIGDLSLLGCALIGEFRGHKSGHTLNHALLCALLAQPGSWEIISGELPAAAPW